MVSYFENGEIVTHEIDGERLVPSVVYIEAQAGRRTVGAAAVDEWAAPQFNPQHAFRRWKLAMGQGNVLDTIRVGGASVLDVTAEQLTTWLVEYVSGHVVEGIGGREVESAVITVPHGWRREHPERCAATRQAASKAVVGGEALVIQPVTLSEPVAAAAYWLWEVQRHDPGLLDDFLNRTILVVDVGGGTFDLSLVQVRPPGEPLVVIDAINNDIAGDYVTALVLGRVTREANERFGAGLPTDPEVLLEALASGDSTWVRAWFLEAQRLVKTMSLRIRQASLTGRSVVPIRLTFESMDDDSPILQPVTVQLNQEEFYELLEPFFDISSALIRRFLTDQREAHLPHGIVFAGGGSRIAGLKDRVLRPTLDGIVEEPTAVLDRIVMNDQQTDRAISLGAALVAAGEVQIEERLLYDVGLIVEVPDQDMRGRLGLKDNEREVCVAPLLERGSRLPAGYRTEKLPLYFPNCSQYIVSVAVFDDVLDPYIQTWSRPKARGGALKVSFDLLADADGVLTVDINFVDGSREVVYGATTRVRNARVSTLSLGDPARRDGSYRIVAPEVFGYLRVSEGGVNL